MEYRDLLAPVQSKPYKESEECRKKGHLMSAECLIQIVLLFGAKHVTYIMKMRQQNKINI